MKRILLVTLGLSLLAGCNSEEILSNSPTYYGSAKAILDANCVSCHQPGDIAPFRLDTYEAASSIHKSVIWSVETKTMPPWPPSNDCTEYQHNRSLPDEELATLRAWSDGGALEGDPSEEPAPADDDGGELRVDLTLQMTEAYVPQTSPDDYRCVLVDWPEAQNKFVTGFQVLPDRRDMVHHVIAYVASPDAAGAYRSLDEGEAGVGYSCYGGPGGSNGGLGSSVRWLASWAPGGGARPFPEGTGIEVEPGSLLILQMHYNTLTVEPALDQSSIEFQLDTAVERPALVLPFTNIQWVLGTEPMHIPAGVADVSHETHRDLSNWALSYIASSIGLSDGDDFTVHSVGGHMHQLGTRISTWVERSDGSSECLLDIPDWDFSWQGSYELAKPVTIRPGDETWLECHWDNTEENQAIVDGEAVTPADVGWGDGTSDEMCLGVYYITAAEPPN